MGSHRSTARFPLLALLAILGACSSREGGLPSFFRWGKIEFIFQGPSLSGLGEPNPFAIPFDVLFTGPDASAWLVPGFYDGDGKGGLDGNIWKVRFSADRSGVWTWHTQSPEARLNGLNGSISVLDPPSGAPAFYRLGRLEYVDERYLKFREGGYWIKSGADEPENLLGGAFGAGDWEAKKRQIDYLAATGVNSVYVVTHNVGGDNQDVWPWIGADVEEARRNARRFDPDRLERWRDLFEYIQAKGLVIHFVLQDDSAWTGYDYSRYYREIVARFGYLPGLIINFGEEHNERHTLAEALGHMDLLGTIDPYHHPRAIHNVNAPAPEYVDHPAVHLASIQTSPFKPASLNRLAVEWFEAPLARRKRPLVVSFDEARPADDRRSWWAVYLGGGVWEGLLRIEKGFAEFDGVWKELVRARQFMESLPVERMFPANHLVVSGEAYCLARPGEVYALYLPAGGAVAVDLVAGNAYEVRWFDPRVSGPEPWRKADGVPGGRQILTAPGPGDWAVRLRRESGDAAAPPTAASAVVFSRRNEAVRVHLAVLPREDAAGLEYEITRPPLSGGLSGAPPDVDYTPRRGFTGRDRFEWRARSSRGHSNTATVTITCSASGANQPPRVFDQSVTARAGVPVTFALQYSDRDGPGPYRIFITRPPAHGTISGLDNDITYTAGRGYEGADSIEWEAGDGDARSGRATVGITVRR